MITQTDDLDVYEIIDLIKSRTIPPEDLTIVAIKTYSYEVLLKLKDELELLLFLLDITEFWDFIKSNKTIHPLTASSIMLFFMNSLIFSL